jgi:hypothetical protein
LQVYDEQPFVLPGEVSTPNVDAVIFQGQPDALIGQGTFDPDSGQWSGEGNWHILTADRRAYDNVPHEGFETKEALDTFVRQFSDFADFRRSPRGDGISVEEAKKILAPARTCRRTFSAPRRKPPKSPESTFQTKPWACTTRVPSM